MNNEILSPENWKEISPIFRHPSFDDHEQVVFCQDKDTGLKAIIGIHNTILGPALGGTRMWQYASEWDALNDVLRLSRGMTYKSAISGLELGGGKAVIIGNSKTEKTPELMIRFGRFVENLSGKYITAEDMGMEASDMDAIKTVTDHVVGISERQGGSGNPSPVTAYGVYMGMKAAAGYKYGSDSLEGKVVLVQGIGHVGEALVELLTKEGAKTIISDLDRDRLEAVRAKYNADIFEGDNLYTTPADIYAPCAMGATLNDETISQLKVDIIAGSANNQLADDLRNGRQIMDRGIVYAPDFLINAGGLMNVYYREIKGLTHEETLKKTENIYHTTLEILESADKDNLGIQEAAMRIAEQRINRKKQEKK